MCLGFLALLTGVFFGRPVLVAACCDPSFVRVVRVHLIVQLTMVHFPSGGACSHPRHQCAARTHALNETVVREINSTNPIQLSAREQVTQ